MNTALLSLFVPTFFFVSITPGMCMTLALTLGMTVGIKKAMWMMVGELVGVGTVAISSLIGVAAIMLNKPELFAVFKIAGGLYLAYLGVQLWRSRGSMAISQASANQPTSRLALMSQGFITAIANPKGWAFFIALLPPFIDASRPLLAQTVQLLTIILLLEWLCLLIYALSGRSLARLLSQPKHVKTLNRIAGSLMIFVAVWLWMT